MSGRIRPKSGKMVTHPKRERRRQRAADRFAEYENLSIEEKITRRLETQEKHNSKKVV